MKNIIKLIDNAYKNITFAIHENIIAMQIAISIIAFILLICLFVFTRGLWDKPKDTVDMVKKFDVIVKKGLSLGEDARILELRDNFVKVGIRNHNGEKAFMVKQRPGKEFRVLYSSIYDREYKDFKFNHVYPDSFDQNEIVAQFEKEIEALSVKR